MESNKDEALRCLDIAKARLAARDIAAALKHAKKSLKLFPTKEAEGWYA